MIYTDFDIKEAITFQEISINPFTPENLGSNSYDLTLFPQLLIYDNLILDSKKPNPTKSISIPETGYILQPNQLYLAKTNETTQSNKAVPIITGKSSLARLGIAIHQTAGFGDIGWKGTWTLEISTILPVIIYPNIKIAQIYFIKSNGSCTTPYNQKKLAKYNNQNDITPSLNHLNFT
jgi:dCTP deaminase